MKTYPIISLLAFSALIFGMKLNALSVYPESSMPDGIRLTGQFIATQSSSLNLQNENYEWLGIMDAQWLNENNHLTQYHTNAPLLPNWRSSYDSSKIEIWTSGAPTTFSFTVPDDFGYEYSFWIQNSSSSNTEIVEWDYSGPTVISTNSISIVSSGLLLQRDMTYTVRTLNETSSGLFGNEYSFNMVAVPEPSTYALILGGLALGFVTLRRK